MNGNGAPPPEDAARPLPPPPGAPCGREAGEGGNGNGRAVRSAVAPAEFRRRLDGQGSGIEHARAASPPETASVTHGGYLRGALHCDACAVAQHCERHQAGGTCARDEEYTGERRRLLARAVRDSDQDPALHAALIERAVLAGVVIERMTRYLAVFGDLEPSALRKGVVRQQPGLEFVLKAMGAERLALEALNLTPSAMVKLDAQRDRGPSSLAALIMGTGAGPALDAGETVDVEYQEDETDAEEGEEHDC